MKLRLGALFILMVGWCLLLQPSSASALSLRMQPLLYKGTLHENSTEKGFVDVSNTSGQTVTLTTSVQAFRQTDDKGSLQFYDDSSVQAGIIPDLKEFSLKPGEALHLAFLIDGRKLPWGDVFAALFVTTKPVPGAVVSQSVRVGTLFTLVNGRPGLRQAAVTSLDVPLFNFGTTVAGTYRVKNTADPHQVNGFYPDVTVSVQPFAKQQIVSSPLVMAGNARQVSFSLPVNRFGIYKIQASYQESSQAKWVFIMTGYWHWLGPLLLGVFGVLVCAIHQWRRYRRSRITPNR